MPWRNACLLLQPQLPLLTTFMSFRIAIFFNKDLPPMTPGGLALYILSAFNPLMASEMNCGSPHPRLGWISGSMMQGFPTHPF